MERIAEAAERQVARTRADVDRPADRLGLVAHVDGLVRACDLGDDELRGKRHAGDALVVVDGGRDHSRDEGAVAFLVAERAASNPAPGLPDPGTREFRVAPVDARVDDRHTHRVHDGQVCRKGVEGVVLSQVVLLRREGVVRDEARAKRNRSSDRRQSERHGRESRCLHEVETWSTGEKPTTKPWPELTRARYTPVESCSLTRKSPFAPTVAWPTVGQDSPCCFWISTVVPASDTGRT